MGLDAVEIVIRAEELFGVSLLDADLELVDTVRDLYKLICNELRLSPLSEPPTPNILPVITEEQKSWGFVVRQTSLPAPPEVLPWSAQSVWSCLVAIFVDQMRLPKAEIRPDARIGEDLKIS